MLNNIIIRLIIYYICWLAALNGVFYFFPSILYYVAQERERIIVGQSLDLGNDVPVPIGSIEEGVFRMADPEHTIPVLVALVLAFGVTLPITWVYRWTRPRKRYNQSFSHTLLMIPIAIALVVFLVKGSLALAFSLAGIVAAVRFRTSLEEAMDAVYMFITIGIGLAAGTQLTTVAYLASLVFVTVSLGLWKLNYGARPAVISGWSLVGSENPKQDDKPTARGKSHDARIEVRAARIVEIQEATAQILDASAKRWRAAEVVAKEDGTAIAVFDIWLKKSVNPLSLVRDIEECGKGVIDSVRLKK